MLVRALAALASLGAGALLQEMATYPNTMLLAYSSFIYNANWAVILLAMRMHRGGPFDAIFSQ